MKALLIEFTVSVVALLLVFFLGMSWGVHKAHDEAATQKTAAVQALHDRYVGEVANANAATAKSLLNQRALEASYADLDQRFQNLRKRTPLVVRVPAADGAVCAAGVQPPAPTGATPGGPVPGSIALPAPDTAVPFDAVPALTLAAVRMWNSALVGADTATGACRADAATAEADIACAQSAGVDLDDAWRNHAVNARACAIDRARHQDLIDYLKTREGQRP